MNSVYVEKFIFSILKNANLTSVTFTNDACNDRNTVAFEKWDLVLSQNRCFFSDSVKIKYKKTAIKWFCS